MVRINIMVQIFIIFQFTVRYMSGMLLLSSFLEVPYVLENAKRTDRSKSILSWSTGTDQLNGNCSKVVCCNSIRFPIKMPIAKPTRELLTTKIRASYRKSLIKMDLVKPRLSMMLTSLLCSIMLALIEDDRLKKHRAMATTVMMTNTFYRLFDFFSCSYRWLPSHESILYQFFHLPFSEAARLV